MKKLIIAIVAATAVITPSIAPTTFFIILLFTLSLGVVNNIIVIAAKNSEIASVSLL